MRLCKTYDNGLKVIINKIEGMTSVTAGVLVKTGSGNESESENGISHFIEHTVFKGTAKRTAFEISDYIDRIGAQINAFTSKELTCYYTKSTEEHLEHSLEVLSDIFFDAQFDKDELEKEKGVIIEEINMSEDSPEDLCLDLLAESYYGKEGLGKTILGSAKNVRRFNKDDVLKYMDKYYCADNVVISIAGAADLETAERLCEQYFSDRFKRLKSAPQAKTSVVNNGNLMKSKKIEQAHIGLAMPAFSSADERSDAFNIANTVLGGGMSSRLFQKVREDLGLAYTVYSYPSQYEDNGVLEIYAGVNTASRDLAVEAILEEIKRFKKHGVTEQEFSRGKEQLKSSFVYSRESTAAQMLLYGKYLIFLNKEFDFHERMKKIDSITIEQVNDAINDAFALDKLAAATVGPTRKSLKLS